MKLTRTERQVANLAALGLTDKEIACQTGKKAQAIGTCLGRIYRRCAFSSGTPRVLLVLLLLRERYE